MLETLTPREREIFDLLLEGVSPKEIAQKLNISNHTVAFHRTKMYNKLDVQSIQELFAQYSTNGKAPPFEAIESEKTAPVSPVNKKKLKIFLPVGITLVALSVLLLLIMTLDRKQTADTTPKGVIIPIYDLGFSPWSDSMERGWDSTSEVNITQEEIDGVTIDFVLNIKTNLVQRADDSTTIFTSAFTDRPDLVQLLRHANGIRFKARGDGKSWSVEFQTLESTPERDNACYSYIFSTIRDRVIVVDIPYSSLLLPYWWEQYRFDFNKERIRRMAIIRNHSHHDYGSAFLQIFDFEIY
jgi:DNA-binding CsgD family transcriptional regulator